MVGKGGVALGNVRGEQREEAKAREIHQQQGKWE